MLAQYQDPAERFVCVLAMRVFVLAQPILVQVVARCCPVSGTCGKVQATARKVVEQHERRHECCPLAWQEDTKMIDKQFYQEHSIPTSGKPILT